MEKTFFFALCFLSVLLSCGGKKEAEVEKSRQMDDGNQVTEGFYEAKMSPLNTEFSGSTVGVFRFRIQGDEVRVRGEMENSPGGSHRQYIHVKSDCPGPGADYDLDGIISIDEALALTGKALIPLDGDLSSQSRGGTFPVPQNYGNYTYFEANSLSLMLSDLHADNLDPESFLTKLPPREDLNLAGRTIMIYGIPGNSFFPISCGTIERAD